MATKQIRSTMDAVHPSRQAQVPRITKPAKKPRRIEPPIYKKQAHSSSVNTKKKRIRDIKRRLERSQNLPATVRAEDERALAAYEQELAAAGEEKARQKMIKKYHMVRFFERQKATRELKKLRKRLLQAESKEEVTITKIKMHVAEVDLNYTQYFPLYQRYISLYPQKNPSASERSAQDEDTDDMTKKPWMWAEVEKRMADGTLNQLRNGSSVNRGNIRDSQPIRVKSKVGSTQAKRNSQVAATSPKPPTGLNIRNKESTGHLEHRNSDYGERSASKKATNDRDKDEESDGGFFEE